MEPNILPLEQQKLGRYRLLYRIASGGMASVYLARLAGVSGFEKLVAVKRIHEHLTENEEFVNMFIDEARLAAQISHPNVVQVIELGNEGNSHYMVMDYVEGESLLGLVRRTKPPLEICAKVIAQAAAGLHAAHELRDRTGELLGVIHRDVSPQNLLLSYDGAVKVADFGVARARGRLHVTTADNVKGKFSYMAPEQARRQPLDRRVDIFALGIVLFEICTRHRLFKGQSEADSIARVLSLEVPRPSAIYKSFPASLERVIMRALERDPNARFQTAEEMQAALESCLMEVGKPVLQSQIAGLMRAIFSDRIAEKEALLQRCQQQVAQEEQALDDDEELPGLEDQSASSSMGVPTAGTLGRHVMENQSQLLRRRRWQLVAVGVALAAVLGVLAYVLISRRATPPQVTKPAVKPKGKITISVQARPKSARIEVAGRAVKNPYEVERSRGEGSLAVVVRAAGYATQQLEVPLSRSGSFMIALEKLSPDAGPAKADAAPKKIARRRRKWRRRKKVASKRKQPKTKVVKAKADPKKTPAAKPTKTTPATKKPKKDKPELFGDPF